MIDWLWLVPAFIAGGFMGVAVMCLMFISKESDDVIREIADSAGEYYERERVDEGGSKYTRLNHPFAGEANQYVGGAGEAPRGKE